MKKTIHIIITLLLLASSLAAQQTRQLNATAVSATEGTLTWPDKLKLKAGGWIELPSTAGDPSSPVNGALWYNTVTGTVRIRQGGSTISAGGGGGGGSVATDTIFDAAGDLAVGSGADTAVRLPRGTAGQLFRTNLAGTNVEYFTAGTMHLQDASNVSITGGTVQDVVLTTPSFSDLGLFRVNSATMFLFDAPATPVNYFEWRSSAAGNNLALHLKGTDTDISVDIIPKGAGSVNVSGPLNVSTTIGAGGAITAGGALNGDSLSITNDGLITGNLGVSGVITGNGSGITTLDAANLASGTIAGARYADGTITITKLANMATSSFLGRVTAGTGQVEVLSVANAKSILSIANVENTALSTWAGSTNITTLGTITTGTVPVARVNGSANVNTLLGAADYAAFKTSLSLNNVENTALSTWTGSTNIATLGTITSGTWSATTVAVNKGGTGLTSGTSGGVLYYSASGTLASSGALAANAIVVGGGAGVAPSTVTTGTGVLTAVSNAVNTTGGIVTKGTETDTFIVAISDETTALTTGTAKVTFRAPYAFTVTGVRLSTTTANTGGTLLTVDINEAGTTILSTKLTCDASEKTSTTAATAAVISDSSIADDAEITIDIDAIGSTIAGAGAKVYITHTH